MLIGRCKEEISIFKTTIDLVARKIFLMFSNAFEFSSGTVLNRRRKKRVVRSVSDNGEDNRSRYVNHVTEENIIYRVFQK